MGIATILNTFVQAPPTRNSISPSFVWLIFRLHYTSHFDFLFVYFFFNLVLYVTANTIFTSVYIVAIVSNSIYKTQNKQTYKETRQFVCLFVRCVCQGRPSYGGTNRDAS